MRNIKLTIQYEGTNYSGWQFQTNGTSIQETIQKALGKITEEEISLKGASRTDAGVHALGQVAVFKTNSNAPLSAFKEGLNSLLPDDIIVTEAKEVDPSFDPNKLALKKWYRYCIQMGENNSILSKRYSWHVKKSLDLKAMAEASKYFLGEKDFKSFQAANTDIKTSVRNIHSIAFEYGPLDLLFIDFTANGFLKYMVRNIVGTLVDVGLGKTKPLDVKEIIESRDRREAGPTAPPCGLFLVEIYYSD